MPDFESAIRESGAGYVTGVGLNVSGGIELFTF